MLDTHKDPLLSTNILTARKSDEGSCMFGSMFNLANSIIGAGVSNKEGIGINGGGRCDVCLCAGIIIQVANS